MSNLLASVTQGATLSLVYVATVKATGAVIDLSGLSAIDFVIDFKESKVAVNCFAADMAAAVIGKITVVIPATVTVDFPVGSFRCHYRNTNGTVIEIQLDDYELIVKRGIDCRP